MKLEIKDPNGLTIQSLDLPQGDYTISVTGATHAQMGLGEVNSAHTSSKQAYIAIFLSLTAAVLYSLNQYFNTAHLNLEATDSLKNAIEVLLGILFSVTIFSFLSRALTHQFNVWKCAILVISSFLFYFALSQNLFGLRWAFPRFFWIREIYNMLLIAGIGVFVWQTIKLFLPQMGILWRKIVTSLIVFFILVYSLLNYLPFRREYVFYHIDTPPPRPQIVDSAPVTVEQFLDILTEQLEPELPKQR